MSNSAVLFCFTLAAVGAAGNWYLLYLDWRNRRKGIKRHVSMIPLIAQIPVLIGALIPFHAPEVRNIPMLFFVGIALADPSFLLLIRALIQMPFAIYEKHKDKSKNK
jgi:hypothetical protein